MKHNQTLALIKELESKNYPPGYCYIQDCESWGDLLEYCEANDSEDLIMLHSENYYFLAVISTREIVDICGTIGFREIIEIRNTIRRYFKGSVVNLDSRDKTSYRLCLLLGKVLKDETYLWDNEVFHDMEILIK